MKLRGSGTNRNGYHRDKESRELEGDIHFITHQPSLQICDLNSELTACVSAEPPAQTKGTVNMLVNNPCHGIGTQKIKT